MSKVEKRVRRVERATDNYVRGQEEYLKFWLAALSDNAEAVYQKATAYFGKMINMNPDGTVGPEHKKLKFRDPAS